MSKEAHEFAEKQERVLHSIEMLCFLIIWPLEKVLPHKEYPIVSSIMIFGVIYFMVEFIIIVMNVFSIYTGMSHFMVGVTLMVWGSDNMEMLSLAIAITKGEEEMATLAVVSCQIICLALVIPVACMSRIVSRDQPEI
jgi:Ca2+/Na+ antiporter